MTDFTLNVCDDHFWL